MGGLIEEAGRCDTRELGLLRYTESFECESMYIGFVEHVFMRQSAAYSRRLCASRI